MLIFQKYIFKFLSAFKRVTYSLCCSPYLLACFNCWNFPDIYILQIVGNYGEFMHIIAETFPILEQRFSNIYHFLIDRNGLY